MSLIWHGDLKPELTESLHDCPLQNLRNVAHVNLSSILHGRTWTAVGFQLFQVCIFLRFTTSRLRIPKFFESL